MPLYEYQCESCGDRFETIQKFSDEPLKVHEKCGGPVHRLISVSALQFKGSGFYITDYKSGSGGNGAIKSGDSKSGENSKVEKSESSSSDSGGKAESKSDSGSSKSDSKPAPAPSAPAPSSGASSPSQNK